MPSTLHYIYDPLCGWCYGNAPLLKAASDMPGLQTFLHAGGMMAGSGRQRVTPELRAFVLQHDARVAKLTGQPFGRQYQEGLLRDESAWFDSEPPITAILAAARFGRDHEMLERIQKAHWVEGRRISERQVLMDLAAEIGFERTGYETAFDECAGEVTVRHIAESRELLRRVGGSGFPTYVYENGETLRRLDSATFLGRPAEWRQELERLI